ncbi:MAG: DMT family protein [Synergistaceae bacterium]|nr:DMT family protein [Synergistaceae bacterium]
MSNLARSLAPVLLLLVSNIFMTYAWYGHLKHMGSKPLLFAILSSWGIAFFEYCFQVPANRLGYQIYTLPQLKIMQEVITMCVFAGFTLFVMKEKLTLNYLWASLCMVGAVFFIFNPD